MTSEAPSLKALRTRKYRDQSLDRRQRDRLMTKTRAQAAEQLIRENPGRFNTILEQIREQAGIEPRNPGRPRGTKTTGSGDEKSSGVRPVGDSQDPLRNPLDD